MAARAPCARTQPRGGRPLDPDRSAADGGGLDREPAAGPDAPGGWSAGGGAATGSRPTEPPGLAAQLKATLAAAAGLVRAHVALGRAEAEAIKGEVLFAAAFAALAVGALLLLGVFLPIVTMLFLGEWLFGSIGWGVLLGAELLLVVAATAVVVGLRLEGPVPAAAAAAVTGVVAFVVFGASWPFMVWERLGEAVSLGVDPVNRPVVVAVVVVGVLGALVGLAAGARALGGSGAIAGLVAGLIVGGFAGAFLAYDFGWRVGAALGVATAYAVYLLVLGARVASGGIDAEKIKLRFWPQQTIDTTKETIEWAKARNPLGPKS